MLNKKTFLIFSIILFTGLYSFVEFVSTEGVKNFRLYNDSLIVDPLSFASLYALVISIVFLFFSETVFKKWLRKVVSWFLPLSVILILTGTDGNSYTWLSRTDITIFMGVVLVAITLVFALVQRFRYKV